MQNPEIWICEITITVHIFLPYFITIETYKVISLGIVTSLIVQVIAGTLCANYLYGTLGIEPFYLITQYDGSGDEVWSCQQVEGLGTYTSGSGCRSVIFDTGVTTCALQVNNMNLNGTIGSAWVVCPYEQGFRTWFLYDYNDLSGTDTINDQINCCDNYMEESDCFYQGSTCGDNSIAYDDANQPLASAMYSQYCQQ